MADRNPNIPSERRADVQTRENDNEEENTRRFAENQAKLREQGETLPDKADHISGNREQ